MNKRPVLPGGNEPDSMAGMFSCPEPERVIEVTRERTDGAVISRRVQTRCMSEADHSAYAKMARWWMVMGTVRH